MDIEIVNILKKYGCAFMETENKEMLEEIETLIKSKDAEQLRLCGVLKPLKDKNLLSLKDWIDSYKYTVSGADYVDKHGKFISTYDIWLKWKEYRGSI